MTNHMRSCQLPLPVPASSASAKTSPSSPVSTADVGWASLCSACLVCFKVIPLTCRASLFSLFSSIYLSHSFSSLSLFVCLSVCLFSLSLLSLSLFSLSFLSLSPIPKTTPTPTPTPPHPRAEAFPHKRAQTLGACSCWHRHLLVQNVACSACTQSALTALTALLHLRLLLRLHLGLGRQGSADVLVQDHEQNLLRQAVCVRQLMRSLAPGAQCIQRHGRVSHIPICLYQNVLG